MDRATTSVEWSEFPIDLEPRPLILLSSGVNPAGFTTAESKQAWFSGAIQVDADVPDAVIALLPQREDRGPDSAPHLILNQATQQSARFVTDRGRVDLPAWTLRGPDVLPAGITILAPVVQPWWSLDDYPDARGWLQRPALIDAGGTTLQWPIALRQGGDALGVAFDEHRTHVVGHSLIRPRQRTGRIQPMTLGLRTTVVEGHLTQPLGRRVLVTETLEPVAAVAKYWPEVE